MVDYKTWVPTTIILITEKGMRLGTRHRDVAKIAEVYLRTRSSHCLKSWVPVDLSHHLFFMSEKGILVPKYSRTTSVLKEP